MHIEIENMLGQNITVVYDSLDLTKVDSSKLKSLRGPAAQAAVMDVPEMVVAIFPPEPILVQIGDKRIRVTLQNTQAIGSIPLWDYASRCMKIVGGSKLGVIAYGFNYDIVVSVQDVSAANLLLERFMPNAAGIAARLNGEVQSILPRIRYVKSEVSYDLILESINEGQIKAHLNAHFDVVQHKFPSVEKLKSSFLGEYRHFEDMILRLLN